MKKSAKPQNFNPSQEDLSRVGKQIAKHLSSDKVVVAGEEKIKGLKEYSPQDFEPMILSPDPVEYGDMKISSDVQILRDEEMITINLLDGDFEVNVEMLDLINQTVNSLNLSSIEDLKNVSEKDFFEIFTTLINKRYNLK